MIGITIALILLVIMMIGLMFGIAIVRILIWIASILFEIMSD